MYNFFEKDVTEKRTYLKDLFNSVKGKSPVYTKIFNILSSSKSVKEDYLNKMYKLVEQARKNNELRLKESDLSKLEKIHDIIKGIHEQENIEKDENIDSTLESKLLDL